MGISSSSNFASLVKNTYLQKLCGEEAIPLKDQFWETLLEFTVQSPENSADARLLEESVGPLCESFVKNNEKSGSFATLLSIITSLIKQITREKSGEKSGDACEALFNSLLILKTLVKYIVQHVPLDQSPSFFVTCENIPVTPSPGDPEVSPTVLKQVARYETSVDELLFYLFEYMTTQAVGDGNVETHNECLQIVTILCSAHLYHPSIPSPYLATLSEGRCASLAELLVRTLLERAVTEREMVQTSSALWTYLMGSPALLCPYYSRDCLLLLVLLTSHTRGVYRGILDSAGHKEPGTNTTRETSFLVDMEQVYLFFCKETISEEKTLLLYTLVQGNPNARTYILSRTDTEQLLLPLLRVLYNADCHSTHHLYMVLILLLILTHDDAFSSYVHDQILTSVPWYKERILTDISAGGLLILIILRTIQANMTKLRDRYLHTNCLAALANLSSKFHSFHPYVAEKLVNLFCNFVKKHGKLSSACESTEDITEVQAAELSTLEDVIRIFLEVFNCSLCYSGKNNTALIYEMLHKREVFTRFRTHPTLSEHVVNIETVLACLTDRLELKTEQEGVSVTGVQEVIEELARQWPSDRLQMTPVLKFEYIEESESNEFFVPYIWTLIFSESSLYWDTSRITLR